MCWEEGGNDVEKQWVKEALRVSWEAESQVRVQATVMKLPGSMCRGDSGGPVVFDGVTERGRQFAMWSAGYYDQHYVGHVAWMSRSILQELLSGRFSSVANASSGFELQGVVHSTVTISGSPQEVVDGCRARCASAGVHCEAFTAHWQTSSCTLFRIKPRNIRRREPRAS